MATVHLKENENFDSLFRRWKRKCANEGIVTDLKRHVEYKKPSIKRKEKMENARKQRRG